MMSCKDRRIHRAERDGLDDLQYGGALDDVVPVVDIRSFGDAMHATIPMFTMGSLHRLISCAKERQHVLTNPLSVISCSRRKVCRVLEVLLIPQSPTKE